MNLQQNHEGSSIVIPGAWNTRIFSPDWISGGRLTDSTDIEIELGISVPGMPVRYIFDDVQLSVSQDRLVLIPKKSEKDLLGRIENVAKKICNDLSHTPISGVGINFQYVAESPEGEIVNFFRGVDLGLLSENDYKVHTSEVKRVFQVEEAKVTLSQKYDDDSSNVTIDFNFHHAATSPQAAVEIINGKMEQYQSAAHRVLNALGYSQE